MASVSTDRNGNRVIQFTTGDGKRRTLRLGNADMKTACDVMRRIETLNVAQITGQVMGHDLAEWVASTSDKSHAKFAAVGLIPPREKVQAATMPAHSAFLADFLAKFEGSKESTLSAIRVATKRLTAYFGEDVPLDTIISGQADNWLQ